ncbi:hypothetical protein HDV00_010960 [Rhizophlyctis rosea]|nr:hypothetical protein HDV00_010960 [Rhizophlyctis rosea]
MTDECRRCSALELELKAQTQGISQVRAALKDTSGKLRTAETELLQTHEQGKVRNLQQQHAQKDAQIAKLETELQALRAKHVEKETEMNALRENVGQMEHQLEDPRNATDPEKNNSEQQSLERIEAAQQSTRDIQTLYNNLQQKKSAVEARLDEVVASLREAEAIQEELEEAHALLKFQYAEVLIERDQQSAKLRECYAAVDALHQMEERVSSSLRRRDHTIRNLQRDLAELKKALAIAEASASDARVMLRSREQYYEEVERRLGDEVRLLRKDIFLSGKRHSDSVRRGKVLTRKFRNDIASLNSVLRERQTAYAVAAEERDACDQRRPMEVLDFEREIDLLESSVITVRLERDNASAERDMARKEKEDGAQAYEELMNAKMMLDEVFEKLQKDTMAVADGEEDGG